MSLQNQLTRSNAIVKNYQNALSFLQTMDGGYGVTGNIIDRISELRTLADDVTKNSSDIANYNTEFKELQQQLINIRSEKFNGISLYNPYSAAETGFQAELFIGAKQDITRNAFFETVTTVTAGTSFNPVTVAGTSGTTPDQTVNGTGNVGTVADQTVNGTQNVGGTQKWSFPAANNVQVGPNIASDGTVYITDGNLYAVNPDGSQKWKSGISSARIPVAGSDGAIYSGSSDGNLYAFNADGSQKWAYSVGTLPSEAFIHSDGSIYVSSLNNIHAINADGSSKWVFAPGASTIDASFKPSVASDGSTYTGATDGIVYATNSDGSLKWTFDPGTGSATAKRAAIASDGSLYTATADGKIYALDTSGAQKWVYDMGNSSGNSYDMAIATDGTIYAGDQAGNLHAINADGSQKWIFTMGNRVTGSPVIGADGTIFAGSGSTEGKLYAINSNTGTELYNFTLGLTITDPALSNDGILYTGSTNDRLYAIHTANSYSPPSNLTNIGSGYSPTETAPTVTISGTDKGTLTATSTINADGTLNITFSGSPSGTGNLTVSIADGTVVSSPVMPPANLTNIGSGYDPAEAAPAVTITGADKGTLAGTSSINADGTLNISFTGTPTGTGNLTVSVANGSVFSTPSGLSNQGSGYTTAPTITVSGTDKGTVAGTATVNGDGTVNVSFTGNPTGSGNLTVTATTTAAVTNSDSLGLLDTSKSLTDFSVSDISGYIQKLATARAINGAEQGSLMKNFDVEQKRQESLESALSKIVDVDVAKETSRLAKYQMLTQAGASMMSQANRLSTSTYTTILGLN
jgi:outer membrane protein assembly factor BamB